jgi:hypothetical protein
MMSLVKVWRRKCYFSEFILEQTKGFINKKSQSHQNQYCKNSQSHQSRLFKAHFVLKTLDVVSPLFLVVWILGFILVFHSICFFFLFFVFFGDLLPFRVPFRYPPSRMSRPVNAGLVTETHTLVNYMRLWFGNVTWVFLGHCEKRRTSTSTTLWKLSSSIGVAKTLSPFVVCWRWHCKEFMCCA